MIAGRAKVTTRNFPAALAGLAVNVILIVVLVPPLGIAGRGDRAVRRVRRDDRGHAPPDPPGVRGVVRVAAASSSSRSCSAGCPRPASCCCRRTGWSGSSPAPRCSPRCRSCCSATGFAHSAGARAGAGRCSHEPGEGLPVNRPEISVVMPFAGDECAARGRDRRAARARPARRRRADPGRQLRRGGGARRRRGDPGARASGRRPTPATWARRAAHGEWILFLDADCRAPRGLLDAYFARARGRRRRRARRRGRAAARRATRSPSRYGSARNFLSQQTHLNHPYRPRAVAANLLVRRAAFEQVGGFYEGVRAAEDTDFSWRLQQAGWKLELRRAARGRAPLPRDDRRSFAASGAGTRPAVPGSRAATTGSRPSRRWPERSAGCAAGLGRGWDPGAAPARRAAPRPSTPAGAWSAAATWRSTRCSRRTSSPGWRCRTGPPGAGGGRPPTSSWWPIASRFAAIRWSSSRGRSKRARVEAAARPESPDRRGRRARLQIDYREDDGIAARAAALIALVVRHPLRSVADAAEPPARRASRCPRWRRRSRRLERDRGARVHALRRRRDPGDRAADRATGRPAARRVDPLIADACPDRRPVGVHAVPTTTRCRRRSRAPAPTVELITSRFALRRCPRARRLRRARAVLPPRAWARRARGRGWPPSCSSTSPTCCATAAVARAADVVHFQWLAVQAVDRYLLPRRPTVLTAHDLLPREPRPGQACAQRRLYDAVDAVVVHSRIRARTAGRGGWASTRPRSG